jgi:hypothetical protein
MRKIVTVSLLLATLGVGAVLAGTASARQCTTTCSPDGLGGSRCYTNCW